MLDAMNASPTIKGMYIDGSWVPAARTFEDLNPSDNSLYARIPDGSVEDVRRAIKAAKAAFPAWANLRFHDRAHYLLKIADVWESRKDDFVAAAVAEGGGWFGKGVFEAGYVAEVFRSAAALCYCFDFQIKEKSIVF